MVSTPTLLTTALAPAPKSAPAPKAVTVAVVDGCLFLIGQLWKPVYPVKQRRQVSASFRLPLLPTVMSPATFEVFDTKATLTLSRSGGGGNGNGNGGGGGDVGGCISTGITRTVCRELIFLTVFVDFFDEPLKQKQHTIKNGKRNNKKAMFLSEFELEFEFV